MKETMDQCIENCIRCHGICLQTIAHCLKMGGKHAEPAHITLMQDCVEICQTCANFMLRGSTLHRRACAVCAEICQRCAEDCFRVGADDPGMKSCIDVCQRCAEICRQMATAA